MIGSLNLLLLLMKTTIRATLHLCRCSVSIFLVVLIIHYAISYTHYIKYCLLAYHANIEFDRVDDVFCHFIW